MLLAFSNQTVSPEDDNPKPLSSVSSTTITKNPPAGMTVPDGISFLGFVPA